jgi:hypothetical protein
MSSAAEVVATLNASPATRTRTHRIGFLARSADAEIESPEWTKAGCMSGMEGSGRVQSTLGSCLVEVNPAEGGTQALGAGPFGVPATPAPATEEGAMSDDKSKTGEDRKLISMTDPEEVRDWCKAFGCTEEELQHAVDTVGNSAAQVREYLKSQ